MTALHRVLVDASNLHSGGGVQVAASFLDELSHLIDDPQLLARFPWLHEGLTVEASAAVLENTEPRTAGRLAAEHIDRSWTEVFKWSRAKVKPDVSFTVFGPKYGSTHAARRVVGFADGTSLFPPPLPAAFGSAHARTLVRRKVSRQLFRRADRVVAEASHVRDALIDLWGIPAQRVSVVPNTVNAILRDARMVRPSADDAIVLGYVSRAHPHKNLHLLGAVGRQLRERHGLEVCFLLTLDDAEWSVLDDETRAFSETTGPITVHQLPAFYARCTGSFFPSLLESFSVTPLEALTCGVPLVGSDRPFVREIAGDAAWYFDPTSATDAATAITRMLTHEAERNQRLERGRSLARSWPTARDRALRYVEVIDGELHRR